MKGKSPSLSLQISSLVSICLFIGVVIYGAVQVNSQTTHALIQKEREVDAIARNIAVSSLYPILNQDFTAIENLLIKSTGFPDLVNIVLTDEMGNILSEVADSGDVFLPTFRTDKLSIPLLEVDYLATQDEFIDAWAPIVLGGNIKGWVRVSADLGFVKTIQRKIWQQTIVAGFLIFVVGFFVVQILLRRRMNALQETSEFARKLYQMRNEKINESLGAKELDELAVALNWVSGRLREQDQGLRDQTEELLASNANLKERVKELNCIYSMTRILNSPIFNIHNQLTAIVDMIPPSWQFPQNACARINYMGQEFTSRSFQLSHYFLRREIEVEGEVVGSVEVYYRDKPGNDSEPVFLHEEENLIDEIAARLCVFFTRYKTEQHLQDVNQNLEERVRFRTLELEQEKLRAEKASQAKTEFLSRMSHELRTPMNAVLGFAELVKIQNKGENLTTDQSEFIDEILKAGRHLLELINEVLDLTKLDSEVSEVKLTPVNLQELISSVDSMLEPLAKDCQVSLDVPKNFDHISVYADKLKLKQVVINLVSNAIKYNKPNGSVVIGCTKTDDENVRISVTDTGKGISEADLEAIFRPFERVGNYGGIDGAGIGLTVTKRFVEVMGGEILVESTPGVGSTFTVCLKASPVSEVLSPVGF